MPLSYLPKGPHREGKCARVLFTQNKHSLCECILSDPNNNSTLNYILSITCFLNCCREQVHCVPSLHFLVGNQLIKPSLKGRQVFFFLWITLHLCDHFTSTHLSLIQRSWSTVLQSLKCMKLSCRSLVGPLTAPDTFDLIRPSFSVVRNYILAWHISSVRFRNGGYRSLRGARESSDGSFGRRLNASLRTSERRKCSKWWLWKETLFFFVNSSSEYDVLIWLKAAGMRMHES